MFIQKTLILLLLMVTPLYVSADFQAWMEKVYLQHQSKTLLKEQIKASDQSYDLHLSSVKLARQYALVSMHESISQIINQFSQANDTCALTYNDVAVLLSNHKWFQRYLSWIKDFNSDASYKIDTNTFTTACIRYLSCKRGYPKTNNRLSADELNQCKGDIADVFTRAMSASLQDSKQKDLWYGDEVFDNGTLEDSSFDLSYDISQINTILYANAKRIPTYYLRWPPNYLSKTNQPDSQDIQNLSLFNYTRYSILIPSRLYASNVILPSIDDAINQIQSASQADSSTITSNLQCFDPKPILRSPEGEVFKKEIKRLNNNVLSLDDEQIIEEMIWVISEPYDGTPPPVTFPTLNGEILSLIPDIDTGTPTTEIDWKTPNEKKTDDQPEEKNTCPVNETNINEKSDISKAKPSVIACLKACGSCKEWFFKKACYQWCLCNRYVEEKDFLKWIGGTSVWLKICLIPSTTPDIITPGSKVVSIQEIINQLSAILAKLKESWQAIPSNKPSEFFAPTTKLGKMANTINFRLNITMNDKYQRDNKSNNEELARTYFDKQPPNIPQVQIESMIDAHDHHTDFIRIHTTFWENMKTIFAERASSMEQFTNTQKKKS